ncbi:MAG: ATP synthase subunit C [Oscillospiraceae bacterium]|jgi:V/A-type H+-transporting ATPase subunit K|nr:ATP synthase subunit C [Oscillospiraceae bacterium]
MEYLFSLILVALILLPLYPIYRRKVSGKPVRGALLANIVSFFAIGVVCVGAMAGGALAADAAEELVKAPLDSQAGLGMIAAALATGISGIGGGIAVASAASAALGAISENDKTFGKALIFVALAEGIALYGMIISFTILGKF